MKHNRKTFPAVDYSNDDFQPCWTCARACGGCDWSREFKPVPGWEAEKTFIPGNGDLAESYRIIECPEYIKERRW